MITLAYGSYEISLPNATFGDSDQNHIQVTFMTTMSGKVFSYKRTPCNTTYTISITNISSSLKEDLIEFIELAAGWNLSLTRMWNECTQTLVGHIVNDTLEFESEQGASEPCRTWKTTLQFRGI